MNNINEFNNEKLLNYIGDIDPTYIESAENATTIRIFDKRKWLVLAAAAILLLALIGASSSDFISVWLSDTTWSGFEDSTNGYLRAFTVTEIDGVSLKCYTDYDAREFVFEFTGASEAIYDDLGDSIVIYALKAENAFFTLRIHEDIMHGYNVQERIYEITQKNNREIEAHGRPDVAYQWQSKGWSFIPIDSFADIE